MFGAPEEHEIESPPRELERDRAADPAAGTRYDSEGHGVHETTRCPHLQARALRAFGCAIKRENPAHRKL
jgi:hypothetical protein